MIPLSPAEFATLLDPLGPFEPRVHLAAAVSGGADSMALALLARDWALARGGRVSALIVDHGLRSDSAAEAALTRERLAGQGITPEVLTLHGLTRGPALAERARVARHAALEAACAGSGILHLLFAHHAADQAETVAMRRLAGSLPAGLAAMAALVETSMLRRLRPLLTVPPGRLRAGLRAAGVAWVEDPSNADPATLRARLRALHDDADGAGPAIAAAVAAASARGRARARAEQDSVTEMAARVSLYPEGFAILSPGPVDPAGLAGLLRTVAGAARPPPLRQLASLAAAPAAATLGGARIMPAGRLHQGSWLVVREAAAMAPPVPARPGARWDGRFRLAAGALGLPRDATLGPLGADAGALRRLSPLPAAVLWGLPALRSQGRLFAVPHLDYAVGTAYPRCGVVFDPAGPAVVAPFVAAPFVAVADR
jgi:tRNA(Ile)-lysidine synthase